MGPLVLIAYDFSQLASTEEYHKFHAHCRSMKISSFIWWSFSWWTQLLYDWNLVISLIKDGSINPDRFGFSIMNPLASITNFSLVLNEIQTGSLKGEKLQKKFLLKWRRSRKLINVWFQKEKLGNCFSLFSKRISTPTKQLINSSFYWLNVGDIFSPILDHASYSRKWSCYWGHPRTYDT